MHRLDLLSHNWLAKRILNTHVLAAIQGLSGDVIDLGCGNRPYEEELRSQCSSYYGIDWSKSLHGIHADVICDLNEDLPFRSDQFDWAVCFEVMEHLISPQSTLNEAFRLIRPGGKIVLSAPFQWWIHEAPTDYYRFTRYGLYHILSCAGFHRIEITPTSGFWSMWLLKLNYKIKRMLPRSGVAKAIFTPPAVLFWLFAQALAMALDKFSTDETETVGYFVRATRP